MTIQPDFNEKAQEQHFEHATNFQRLVNLFIDTIMLGIFGFVVLAIVTLCFVNYMDAHPDMHVVVDINRYVLLFVAIVIIRVLFYTLTEGLFRGKTLGKLITSTTTVTEDLQPVGWKKAFTRALVRLVPFEPFTIFSGHILHDRLSKTMVIRNPSTRPRSPRRL